MIGPGSWLLISVAVEESFILLCRKRHKKNSSMAMNARPATAVPIPIPTLAPLVRLGLGPGLEGLVKLGLADADVGGAEVVDAWNKVVDEDVLGELR